MSMRKIVRQIESLASHCESMVDKKDSDSIWQLYIAALNELVEKLEGEFSGANAADVIRQIMEKEDVKPKELAERMGCARQNVSQMLNRGTVNMRYDSFFKLAEVLGYEIVLRKK